jgi:hypothetical protein
MGILISKPFIKRVQITFSALFVHKTVAEFVYDLQALQLVDIIGRRLTIV